jgi:hypothetical protein
MGVCTVVGSAHGMVMGIMLVAMKRWLEWQ